MEESRQVLFEAVLGQGGIPVGLPYPSIPTNYIHKLNSQCLADADYILLLLGNEYGALTEKGVSQVHAAYAAAQGLRKPVVSLIYNGPVNARQDDLDGKRLAGFISQLEGSQAYHWHDDDSLRDSAERALEMIFETHPSVGWIKNDLSKQSRQQDNKLVAQLKEQVAQLKRRLKSAPESVKSAVSLDSDRRSWAVHFHCNAFREGRLKQVDGYLPLLLKDAFGYLAPSLLSPISEIRLQTSLASKIHPKVLGQVQSDWQGCHAVSDVRIGQDSTDELKLRLRALSLIDFDAQGRWVLTPTGEALALRMDG